MAFENILITGSGKYVPKRVVKQEHFTNHKFYDENKKPVEQTGIESAKKLETITGIRERKYAMKNVSTSDMATKAAKEAITDARLDSEVLDQIIVAQNFGDISVHRMQGDFVPSLAARVKHNLKINNPNCVAYDIIFGCPGWLQAMIQSTSYMKSGMAKSTLVVGAETLSRVIDPYDRDSMIYADGAGAIVLQQTTEENKRGVLSTASQSFTKEEAYFLFSGKTNFPDSNDDGLYIKMHGRKIYEFALKNVPLAMKTCFDQSGKNISELKKIFIHQANEKMDDAIVQRFFKLYKMDVPELIMPLNIGEFGNSSVATIPTVYDMVKRGELESHNLQEGDTVLFASVGAGMNINALTYQL